MYNKIHTQKNSMEKTFLDDKMVYYFTQMYLICRNFNTSNYKKTKKYSKKITINAKDSGKKIKSLII